MHAIENSSYSIAAWLIEQGANLEMTNQVKSKLPSLWVSIPHFEHIAIQKGQTALALASLMGYKDLVQLMMNSGAFIDTVDIDGNTPLISAVNRGHLDISTLLLDSGCDANTVNKVNNCFCVISYIGL